MSPESYSWETIESAEELYILDGLTFEAVAERTGVSVSQLKRWSADCTISWPDRRREYRQAQVSVRRGVMLAKARLIESVIETEDPQKAYAFGSLVNSARLVDAEARDRIAGQQTGAVDGQQPLLSDPGDPIEALRLAVQQRTTSLLQSPGSLTLAAVKELLATMELLEQRAQRTSTAATTGTPTSMSPEQLQERIRQVYGI